MKRIIVVFVLSFLFYNSNVFSQAGILDSSFGNNGVGQIAFPKASGNSVIVQPDGKILVGGIDSAFNFALARYNTNGTLDSTFGSNGKVVRGIGNIEDVWGGMALQPDGKILLSGTTRDSDYKWSFILTRFNPNSTSKYGSLDSTFNGIGYEYTSFNDSGYADYGFGVAIQPDGKIVQVGMGQDNSASMLNFAVVRYNNNGEIDNTFGTAGKVLTPIGNGLSYANNVAVQNDGKIVLGGYSSTPITINPTCWALARYNSNGILDNSFGNNGKVITYFGAGGSSGKSFESDYETDMTLQTDGKILMVGTSYLAADSIQSIRTVRYNTDGSPDSSFGRGGIAASLFPDSIYAFEISSVVLQPDGEVVLGGDCDTLGKATHFSLIRYKSNGFIDSSFGSKGFAISSVEGENATSIAIQKDGKILQSGVSSSYGMTIVRYLSDLNLGTLDLTVKQNPILIYPNPIQSQAELQYTLSQNEKLTLSLFDMKGRQVQTFFANQTRTIGEHKETISLNPNLAAGNYILNISNSKSSQGIKIIKQ